MNLNQMAKRCHKIARDHGFWDNERNFGEMIALMHSELSEALEEHRNGNPDHYYKAAWSPAVHPKFDALFFEEGSMKTRDGEVVTFDDLRKWGATVKPEGAAVELVDAIIRELDTLYRMGVDIDALFQEKCDYNEGRGFKHGKDY